MNTAAIWAAGWKIWATALQVCRCAIHMRTKAFDMCPEMCDVAVQAVHVHAIQNSIHLLMLPPPSLVHW
jgi:hypothetical protein